MDLDALRTDLDNVFSLLPPQALEDMSRFVLTHKDILASTFPAALGALMPHIRAGGMEYGLGILDIDEVEKTVMDVLAKHGVKPAVEVPHGGSETTAASIRGNPNRPPGL